MMHPNRRYTSNPSRTGDSWFVWDMEAGIDRDGTPKRIVFTGTMEECGSVADSLAFKRDRQGVCPICGGDCAGANPPVTNCPMRLQPW